MLLKENPVPQRITLDSLSMMQELGGIKIRKSSLV
jgi:hypothetical protein